MMKPNKQIFHLLQTNIKTFQLHKLSIRMLSQQSTIFPKQFKIDDYESSQGNHLIILESSNLLLGTGSRTSTAAIVLAKALQNLRDEGQLNLDGKSILELGSGVGLVGLYLSVLGANVNLCDTPALRDLIQKNMKINREMLKGKVQFFVGSWKKTKCLGECDKVGQSETISTSSSNKNKESCLYHLSKESDLTLVCDCGGLSDLQDQLKLMGKEGMILAFMKRQNWDDGLDQRIVEEHLSWHSFEYQKIKNYHPDYVDNRISIFRIYPSLLRQENQDEQEMVQKIKQTNEQMEEQLNEKVQNMSLSNKMNITD